MTHPQTAPPATAPAVAAPGGPASGPPAVPPPRPPAPPAPPPGEHRRTAFAEGLERLRAAARTEPGRLRIIGAVLAALILLFGTVTAWQAGQRTQGTGRLIDDTQPLTADAAGIYRSLADANTTAATGFLSGANEPPTVREDYEDAVRSAAVLLGAAAQHSAGSPEARAQIRVLSEQLPVYTGLVETARAHNRRGLPLGGAYLRYANTRMQEVLLPAAERLYLLETERFRGELDEARDRPWPALLAGGAALAALGWAQVRHLRRTNRVLNPGLVAATAATALLLGWLAGAHTLARSQLGTAEQQGARSLQVLNEMWIAGLQARGDENLFLVARGSGSVYDDSFRERMELIAGPAGEDTTAGLLADALALAEDEAGRTALGSVGRDLADWRSLHEEAQRAEAGGDYERAVRLVIGAEQSTGVLFDAVDKSLAEAVEHEQRDFRQAASEGRSVLGGLTAGAVALGLAGAVGAVLGIGRRLSEYR
ncbi:hypothetical protein [Streptomyces aidingensis]|uniref:Secreted protein n=1 Tax=Streptomyces aidingensis TaxID=910347 RepID=A0A1I1FFZ5_9ACTN|nr:hypothetical protein [Streptomyces aidingensis]SFB96618.1 hypothetical protein SAMN05421773_101668 [Streptomyces aidingensis]